MLSVNTTHHNGLITMAVSRTETDTRPETWTNRLYVLCRTFHTTPEQGQGPTPIVPHCCGSSPSLYPGTGHSQFDYTIRLHRTHFKNGDFDGTCKQGLNIQ